MSTFAKSSTRSSSCGLGTCVRIIRNALMPSVGGRSALASTSKSSYVAVLSAFVHSTLVFRVARAITSSRSLT